LVVICDCVFLYAVTWLQLDLVC